MDARREHEHSYPARQVHPRTRAPSTRAAFCQPPLLSTARDARSVPRRLRPFVGALTLQLPWSVICAPFTSRCRLLQVVPVSFVSPACCGCCLLPCYERPAPPLPQFFGEFCPCNAHPEA